MFPDFAPNYLALSYCYLGKGLVTEGIASLLDYWSYSSANPEFLEKLNEAFSEGGLQGYYRLQLETQIERANHDYFSPVSLAWRYAQVGRYEEALDWLQKAYEMREFDLPYIRVAHWFDAMRSDRRFQDLLRRMNLPP